MNETDIAELLQKHALTPLGEVNVRAWDYFVADAESDKEWARTVTPEFLERSCDLTREMAKRYSKTPTLVLAAQHYGYSHYRGHAKSGIHWLSPDAKALWDSFESGIGYQSPIVEAE